MNTVTKFSIHRVREYDYSTPGTYRLLLETRGHMEIFGEMREGNMILNPDGEDLLTVLGWAMQRFPYVDVQAWTIVPHGIELCVALTEQPNYKASCVEKTEEEEWLHYRRTMTIPRFVGFVKMNSSRRINQRHNRTGNALWTRRYRACLIPDGAEAADLRKRLDAAFVQIRYSDSNISATKSDEAPPQQASLLQEFFIGNPMDVEPVNVDDVAYSCGYRTLLLGRAIFLTGPMLDSGHERDTDRAQSVAFESSCAATSRLFAIGPGRIVLALPRESQEVSVASENMDSPDSQS
jgi:putative transposase